MVTFLIAATADAIARMPVCTFNVGDLLRTAVPPTMGELRSGLHPRNLVRPVKQDRWSSRSQAVDHAAAQQHHLPKVHPRLIFIPPNLAHRAQLNALCRLHKKGSPVSIWVGYRREPVSLLVGEKLRLAESCSGVLNDAPNPRNRCPRSGSGTIRWERLPMRYPSNPRSLPAAGPGSRLFVRSARRRSANGKSGFPRRTTGSRCTSRL